MADGERRFGVLGPLRLERDGELLPLPGGHQRSLLALLLLAGGVPVSRDRLIDELWGEQPPASAVSALHVHLSKLRGALGELLVHDAAGYSLIPGAFELDARRFDALVEQARAEPGNSVPLLREALGLFRGEPLCDVRCEGSLAQWRRALEEKRLQAIMMRVDGELEAGAAGELISELEQLVAEQRFEERLWGQLMRALYRAGRQADALAAYQRVRRLLADELGIEPGETLTALHQQLLEQHPSLLAETAPPPVPAPTGPSNLPQPLTKLVGRERELGLLDELLADPDVRIITLAGPGGVGKTRLMLELARRHVADHAHGAVLVRLEQLTDPALVAAEIATALAQRDQAEGLGPDGLAGYLRDRELLLVIDNFEHLLPAAVLVAELLELAPKVRLLVSSRASLRIRGEQVFEVEPLDEAQAVELFMQCALAANRRLEVDDAVRWSAAAICGAVDGLPLAIELTASRAQSLSLGEIAERLARPLSMGEHGLQDLPERQRTLEATIRWSYDLLTPSSQTAVRAAGVFFGGFTEAALEAVVGEPARNELDELLVASLVRRRPEPGRYELLELVRAFALHELDLRGEAAGASERNRRYFAALVAPASERFDAGEAPGEVADTFRAEHANVRAALEDATELGDQQSAEVLALGLRPLWFDGMLRQESHELVSRMLESFPLPGHTEIMLLRAAAFLDGFGSVHEGWNARLADRAAELGDIDAVVMATGNIFAAATNKRDREEMARMRPQLEELVSEDAPPKARGWLHYFLALDAYVDGRFEASLEHATISVAAGEEIGHAYMHASAAATRLLAKSAGTQAISREELADALALVQRSSVPPLAAFGLWLVARYAAGVSPEDAGTWLAHSERILAASDSEIWPESVLREETMAVLGITDLAPLLERTPVLEHGAALEQAAEWLRGREAGELSVRTGALEFATATS